MGKRVSWGKYCVGRVFYAIVWCEVGVQDLLLARATCVQSLRFYHINQRQLYLNFMIEIINSLHEP